ncbi:peptidylprolyl isomerase [Sandarakinorhabdus cyanobacteriorum]|uniref:Peptidyl-prolyl cis-trans isomerase n=1 Tax=Sandarakinorhabdus cyanobacteriorum TaxID=1981098 RepID=A0A255Y714_9SPHN|nr:peptidylprolyl isomerase [Sandarakinorhabdus cyanobacteriorum]OYQ24961.1 peptidylprolyl isomerase [Sandarakinorhabdus cyanobacteriorum]
MMRFSTLIAAAMLMAAPALAQQQRIDPKDLKAPPKLPEMAGPSNLAGTLAQVNDENILLLDLSTGGRVKIVMRPDVAPKHVERIKTLVREGFYDGTVFHRVIDGFMAQGGDPTATGQGGSKLPDLKAEFNDLPHVRGAVAMARSQSDDSANSQFYVVLMPVLRLDRTYTVWGRVVEGMKYVDAIEKGEPPDNPSKIIKASIAADKVPAPDFAAIKPAATPIPAGALNLPPPAAGPIPPK